MTESTFIPRAICTTIVFVVALIAGCTATNVYTTTQAARAMQANGADPLDIPCAINQGTERYCEMRAVSKAATQKD